MHQLYIYISIKSTNRKRARTQIQIITSPRSPTISEKRPHPMNHVFPTDLCAQKYNKHYIYNL